MNRKALSKTLALLFLFLSAGLGLSVSRAEDPGTSARSGAPVDYARLPLYFIENRGQLDSRVRFYVKTSGRTVYFLDEGMVFDLYRKIKKDPADQNGMEDGRQTGDRAVQRLVFNLGIENARKGVLIEGLDRREGRINYFVGNDKSRWKRGIPVYGGIVYRGIYRGIDLRISGKGTDIEYEFVVGPGADPRRILLTYRGIEGLSTNNRGELLIDTAFGRLRESRPFIYQGTGEKRMVRGAFRLRGPDAGSRNGRFSYGFEVATYDRSRPLVIDPTLVFSTYLGGNYDEWAHGIAVDSAGSAYVVGETTSTDFPTKNPFQGSMAGTDLIITKFSPYGNSLVFSTYLGGSGDDYGRGITIDRAGNVYVTGHTQSSDFPTTKGAFQETQANSLYDLIVTKLSRSGDELLYSTYLGGRGNDYGSGIAVDSDGSAYVTGLTQSTDFPTTNGAFQTAPASREDSFVTKLAPTGKALEYSTYLGGNGNDAGASIAVDSAGNAYVAGQTYSDDFPTKTPYQSSNAFSPDAFITKVSSGGSSLVFSTYLGGGSTDSGEGVAVDEAGNVYVAGYTYSDDFPRKNSFQDTLGGLSDAFVTRLSAVGKPLIFSTYLGGTDYDWAYALAVDSSGNAYVTGATFSTDFPTRDPFQKEFAGVVDLFITRFSSSGGDPSYSTYLGGTGDDRGYAITVNSLANVYVAGNTKSSDFPTKNPYQSVIAGMQDLLVAKFGVPPSYVTLHGDCGGATPCYQSIQEAIRDAASGSMISIAGGNYEEALVLDQPKSLTLHGGWDADFTVQDSYTTITAITVTAGALAVDRIVLR